jgi:hypothetical protein
MKIFSKVEKESVEVDKINILDYSIFPELCQAQPANRHTVGTRLCTIPPPQLVIYASDGVVKRKQNEIHELASFIFVCYLV